MPQPVITGLDERQSKVITWNQEGSKPGDHIATVHTTSDVSAQVGFEIK